MLRMPAGAVVHVMEDKSVPASNPAFKNFPASMVKKEHVNF